MQVVPNLIDAAVFGVNDPIFNQLDYNGIFAMDESLTYFTPRTPVRGEPLIFTLGGTLLKSINDSTSYGVCLAGRELVPAFKVNWPIPAQGPGPFTTQYTTFWPIDAP